MSGKGILKKYHAVMAGIGAIGKDRQMSAPGAKYNYRGIEDLYNELQPVLVEHGVILIPNISGDIKREYRETTKEYNGNKSTSLVTMVSFILELQLIDIDDGSSLTIRVPAEGYDNSDKASGKAMSYGMKNALFHGLVVPTEDPDGERPSTVSESTTEPGIRATELLEGLREASKRKNREAFQVILDDIKTQVPVAEQHRIKDEVLRLKAECGL